LDALINNQNRIPDEIIIVNGGGENDCQDTLNKWKSIFSNLKIIKTENINLANSRNIGLPYCKGDLILQTDDDARPFPDWIEKIIEAHELYPNVGVVGGDVIDAGGRSYLSQIADTATFPHHYNTCEVRSVPGVNSSYKKEVIDQVGKYDETLFRGEDVDYNWRAIKNGWKVVYIPEIKVYHIHRPTWNGLLKQHYMYGRAHFLVRSKWPEMYSPYPTKIDSIYSFLRWCASWVWFPWLDAFLKSCKMVSRPNGFEFFTLGFINISNRIGTSIQKNFH
jgi:GT2 family glycosyltransferase